MKQHVLVVDDDEGFRRAIAEVLAPVANVATVATPIEALWAIERTRVDVLICDLMLGSGNGADILETVRTQWPSVARILVTGFGDHLRTLAPAAHAIILKPCDLFALRDLIERLPARVEAAPEAALAPAPAPAMAMVSP